MVNQSNVVPSTYKKVGLFVLILLICSGISFFVGSKLTEKRAVQKSELLKKEFAASLEQKDSELEALQLCVEHRGQIVDSYVEPYTYKTFGIASELLANTEVRVTKYRYCQADVVEKYIDLEDKTVRVHYIENLGPYSTEFMTLLLKSQRDTFFRDIPTFNGYENYGLNARLVSEIVTNSWSADESYTSKNGILAFYEKNYAPNYLASLSLHFYSRTSPLGASMFVNVSQDVDSSLFEYGNTDKALLKAKGELKEFIDTVSIEY